MRGLADRDIVALEQLARMVQLAAPHILKNGGAMGEAKRALQAAGIEARRRGDGLQRQVLIEMGVDEGAAIAAIRERTDDQMIVQITTESVGMFSPQQQMETVRATIPEAVSMAVKELVPDPSAEAQVAQFYGWALAHRIAVQHIVYTLGELDLFLRLVRTQVIPGDRHSLFFPLGLYAMTQESRPDELVHFCRGFGAKAATSALYGGFARSALPKRRHWSQPLHSPHS